MGRIAQLTKEALKEFHNAKAEGKSIEERLLIKGKIKGLKLVLEELEPEVDFIDIDEEALMELKEDNESTMNANLKRALELKDNDSELPMVDVGDVVRLFDIWDGEGERPTTSYSYYVNEDYYLTYWFEELGEGFIKVTDIILD